MAGWFIALLVAYACVPCIMAVSPLNLDGSEESFRQLVAHHLKAAEAGGPHRRRMAAKSPKNANRRPNFLVFMTDDQDQLLNSTHEAYMPSLHEDIATKGLQLRSFTVSTSVCCPSRVNMLTGRFAHNTNVTGNIAPRGGYSKFKINKLDKSYLPTWMQSLGYRTYFTGKFLNGFDPMGKDKCPNGWNVFEPLIKPYVLNYWNTSFTTNCQGFHQEPGQYNTDVLLNKTLTYIRDAASYDQPFMIQIWPITPHEGCGPTDDQRDGDSCTDPPYPAPRHANLYQDVQLPVSSNYGRAPPDGTLAWVDSVVRNRGWDIARMTAMYQARLRSLKSMDEMIGTAVALLDVLGQLDNTYVIFMSDNGFKIGNHGVSKGKMTAYEEDVRVPFFIRGPGIPQGIISDYPATVCDVPATIVDLAGATVPALVDGTPLPLKTVVGFVPKTFPNSTWLTGAQGLGQLTKTLRDQVPHEMWVWGSDTRLNGRDYRALRICTSYLAFGKSDDYRAAANASAATFGFRLGGAVSYWASKEDVKYDTPATCYKYVVWCTGVIELYDLMLDPGEVSNRYTIAPARFIDRLHAYMTVQGFCRGRDCYSPYQVLHPNNKVTNFVQAMQPQYDNIYAQLPRFSFKQCTLYYYPENEVGWLKYNTTLGWPKNGAVPSLGGQKVAALPISQQQVAPDTEYDYARP